MNDPYHDWWKAVDATMRERFGIDTEALRIHPNEIYRTYESTITPAEAAECFGYNYKCESVA